MDITSHRIVHHFATSTAASFCSDRQYANTTSISVPHLSWKDPVVLHAMLSCTALHLGRLYPGPNSNNDINWIGLASAHRKAAMAVLPKATTVDAKSLTIALFTMYTISSSLASSPENIFSLMTSLHNVWSALEGHRMYTDEKLNTISLFFDHSHADSGVKTIWHLRRIYDSPTSGIELESEELADSKIRGAYKQAVEALYAAYPFSLTGYESKSAVLWPTQFGKEFCVLLQEKRQRALVVLYYYLEMLKGMNKECWWASDAARCQDYVYGLLDVEWRGWLLDVTEDLTSNTTRLTY